MSIALGEQVISRNGNKVYVIAEIGQNHQGSLDIAKELILEAKKAKADCVKFQKSCLTAKFTKLALDRPYDSVNSWGPTYGAHKQFLEFDEGQYKELQSYCQDVGIDFTASAMDEVSLNFLDSINVPFIKIGSGDANNFPLLEKAANLKRPLVISTGMQNMITVERIIEIMKTAKKTNFALLHCVSAYPTDPKDCNLKMITIFKRKFPDLLIGYSGHELGIDITAAAVLLGAKIVERHFTLDKSMKGSDHMCSLIPMELQQLVENIDKFKQSNFLNRELDASEILKKLGNIKTVQQALNPTVSEKVILLSEMSCKNKLGKSIVAAQHLKARHKLEKKDLWIKVSEPNGIPAENYNIVLGSTLKVNVGQDCPICIEDININ